MHSVDINQENMQGKYKYYSYTIEHFENFDFFDSFDFWCVCPFFKSCPPTVKYILLGFSKSVAKPRWLSYGLWLLARDECLNKNNLNGKKGWETHLSQNPQHVSLSLGPQQYVSVRASSSSNGHTKYPISLT